MKRIGALFLALGLIFSLAACQERKPPVQSVKPEQTEEPKEKSDGLKEPEQSVVINIDDNGLEGIFAEYAKAADKMRYLDSASYEMEVDASLTSNWGGPLGNAAFRLEGEYVRLPFEDFSYHSTITSIGDAKYKAEYTLAENILYHEIGEEKEQRKQTEEQILRRKEEMDGIIFGIPLPFYGDELTLEQVQKAKIEENDSEAGGYRITLYLKDQPMPLVVSLSHFFPLGTNEVYIIPGTVVEDDDADAESATSDVRSSGKPLADMLTTVSYEDDGSDGSGDGAEISWNPDTTDEDASWTGEFGEEKSSDEALIDTEIDEEPYQALLVVDIDGEGYIRSYTYTGEIMVEFPSGNTPTLSLEISYNLTEVDTVKKIPTPANPASFEDFTVYKGEEDETGEEEASA